MSNLETFLWGLAGGLGAELVVFFSIRQLRAHELPYFVRSPRYYIITLIMILFGGLIALAYAKSGTPLNAILAIQVGASTPLILRKFSETISEPPKPPDPDKVN